METVEIYVADLAAYNAGHLRGEWLDLGEFSDGAEVIEAIREHLAAWGAEEWAVHDYDAPEGVAKAYGEDPTEEQLTELCELAEALQTHDAGAVAAYIYLFGDWSTSCFEDRYYGEYESLQEFAYELVESSGILQNVNRTVAQYFDYEAYGRDALLHGSIAEHNGYYFWTY